uniref:Uncharacterized protein n=1 Tax=Oryza sativa subsp. japonica TaxID=39947 RepID=Q69SH4_ORYSJ|nr:hypothetical protein [Oryza sativa Japonica Group]BAD46031.1 hypothetical protein [Oryza sativa Japonica Group]
MEWRGSTTQGRRGGMRCDEEEGKPGRRVRFDILFVVIFAVPISMQVKTRCCHGDEQQQQEEDMLEGERGAEAMLMGVEWSEEESRNHW